MFKIGILNSYLYPGDDASNSIRIRTFLDGLKENGYDPGDDVSVKIFNSNDQNEILEAAGRFVSEGVDIIHAVGTPNASIARQVTDSVPVVYYGAHPQGVGLDECQGDNVCGLEMTLPFTSNYKYFLIIRKIVPYCKKLYVPFYDGTVFCHKKMRESYHDWRGKNGDRWIPSDDAHIGYDGLAKLSEVIDLEYYEFPLSDSTNIQEMFDSIDPSCGMLMVYNDSFYCPDAPAAFISEAWERKLPLIWNNNAAVANYGALAGLAGCLRESASITAEMCTKIFQGESPSHLGLVTADKTYCSYNWAAARRLGLNPSEKLLNKFDKVVDINPF